MSRVSLIDDHGNLHEPPIDDVVGVNSNIIVLDVESERLHKSTTFHWEAVVTHSGETQTGYVVDEEKRMKGKRLTIHLDG